MSSIDGMGRLDVPQSVREPGPGRCMFCHRPVERYRTAGNQFDPGNPLLAAFEPAGVGSWRLGDDAVMHRRTSHAKATGRAYEVHLCDDGAR